MTFWEIWLVGYIVMLLVGVGLWLLSLAIKDASIVDPVWGGLFVVLVWVYFFAAPGGWPVRKVLVLVLVTVWGLRLSGYLLYRNWGKGEDFRYANWREQHGKTWWWRSYLQVFWLQPTIACAISAPLLITQFAPEPAFLTGWDVLGAGLWAFGLYFEAAGDWQLMRFKRDPANKGKLLTGGVWRYSRHPNYFGDAAQWWAYGVIAAGVPWGILTVYGPALMTWLLLRVSGVTMLEKTMTKRPGYEDYIARTSAFIPRPPRRG